MDRYLKHTLYCCWNSKDGRYDRSLGCTCGLDEFKMSIDDPILLDHSPKWGYYLTRGRETFYDKDRVLVTFETPEKAIAWSEKHLGQTPIEIQSEAEREAILEGACKKKKQMKLL